MSEETQYELYEKTIAQKFEDWVHTEGGGWVANCCIRYALRFQREQKNRSIRLIWEMTRADLVDLIQEKAMEGVKVGRVHGYAMLNAFTPHMARFIENRVPSLGGYFVKHELGQQRKRKAVVVPIREK